MRILQAVVALATVIALTLPFAASAQDYPNRRVTLIVPFGPGGPGDLLIRTVAERLEQRWKQPVVVDYRPGAGGLIAHEYVAKAPADGYTLLQGATSFTLYHLLNKDLKFDPLKDLTIVAMTGRSSSVYMTNAQVPASNWNEFVAYAKANPGKVNYASLGRSIVMMGMELLSAQAGIKMTEVAYKGMTDLIQGLVRNDVQIGTNSATAAKPMIDEGKLKPLFIVSDARHPQLPNVPTNAEVGLPNFRPLIWQSIMAPSATPRAVQQKINADVGAITSMPDYAGQIDKIGMLPFSLSLEAIRKITDETVANWTSVARTLNIRPE